MLVRCLAVRHPCYMQELSSDILFARPTFWRGFCRVGDLFGQFDVYNRSMSPIEADALALASDWHMLSIDAANALRELEKELEKENISLALD